MAGMNDPSCAKAALVTNDHGSSSQCSKLLAWSNGKVAKRKVKVYSGKTGEGGTGIANEIKNEQPKITTINSLC